MPRELVPMGGKDAMTGIGEQGRAEGSKGEVKGNPKWRSREKASRKVMVLKQRKGLAMVCSR